MLLEITAPAYDVAFEIAYATANNFTGAPVYARAACFLHPAAAAALRKAIHYAGELDYRLKIFDAFRPAEAQRKLWDHVPDPDFLCPPEKGSPHSRGVAVDLTLIDAHGRELDMGTAFDAFVPASHHGAGEVRPEAKRNRLLLLGIMTSAGWDFYRNEWWHYQLFNASRDYPLRSDTEAGTRMM